jgi:hypothetical protein
MDKSDESTDKITAREADEVADERELMGFVTKQASGQTTTVAGYDLTLAPVKPVRGLARAVEDRHHESAAHALRFLEDNSTYSRRGTDQVV